MFLTQLPMVHDCLISGDIDQFWTEKMYQYIYREQQVRLNPRYGLVGLRDLHATRVCSFVSMASRKPGSSTVGHFASAVCPRRLIKEHVVVALIAID